MMFGKYIEKVIARFNGLQPISALEPFCSRSNLRYSVVEGMSTTQRLHCLILCLVMLCLIEHKKFVPTIICCTNILYLYVTCCKYLLFWHSMSYAKLTGLYNSYQREKYKITTQALPTYTIMIALSDEANIIPQLLSHLNTLDYPAHKLQVLLVLESDDVKTRAALSLLPFNYTIITAPARYPRTKAGACNYALQYAVGELIVIYDAEDRPDKKQLQDIAAMYSIVPLDVACIQCKLQYYNAGENWLTKMFAIEYSLLFHYVLPWIAARNMPVLLGGSSNHFRTYQLRQFGGWDSYNVTEDADLGMYLSRLGYRIIVADSYTMEEAPLSIVAWLKQRARWIKGHALTYMVHTKKLPTQLRTHKRSWQDTIWQRFAFHYLLGVSSAAVLSAPVAISLWLVALCGGSQIGQLCYVLGLLSLYLHIFLILLQAWYVQCHAPYVQTRLWWTYPFYFILHAMAAIIALYQLTRAPYHWDKTKHGVSRYTLYC